MSQFFIFNNVHLAVELLGGIVLFVIAWLFFEGFLIKKDKFSLSRSFGFLLLSFWFAAHAVHGIDYDISSSLIYVYLGALFLIFLSFGLEKLPPKPDGFSAVLALSLGAAVLNNFTTAATILLFFITIALFKRYFKDIERLLKWLGVGFGVLTVSSALSIFVKPEISYLMLSEHVLKIVAFGAMIFWIWQWLSLRIKEETLLVFIAISLFGALVLTTTFSTIFLKQIETAAGKNLALSAQVFDFYLDSLKSKALAATELFARGEELGSALKARDLKEMERLAREFLGGSQQQFLTLAIRNGSVIYKSGAAITSGENILVERVGGEALEGRPAVTINDSESEGFSIRSAAPVYYQNKIIGVVLSGYLLDDDFSKKFKAIGNLETTLFLNEKVAGSSFLAKGEGLGELAIKQRLLNGESFVAAVRLSGQEVIGSFFPIRDGEGKTIAAAALTTTPGELLRSAERTNRLTLMIIFALLGILVLPFYRFTVFLTKQM